MLKCSKKLKTIFEMNNSKYQQITPKISSTEKTETRGKSKNPLIFTPNAILDISAILTKISKQKQKYV
jgi:hypothetical protein